ncbi:group II intron maturase-specific domain-containing protein [Bradyrhizobium sp. Pha-3]|uniref:group II intron maturase-specific domain-containing protein n=1 Tax=Bradyrhizobium sp. Pha-3 TaxID=208375 RepID=UPI0035D3FAD7
MRWHDRRSGSFSGSASPLRTIAPKSLERFKQRIREITRKAKGVSIKTTMEELATYMRGWRGYFGCCETPEVLIALTRWVRLRCGPLCGAMENFTAPPRSTHRKWGFRVG